MKPKPKQPTDRWKTCGQCKEPFHPKRPLQEYCCNRCRITAYKSGRLLTQWTASPFPFMKSIPGLKVDSQDEHLVGAYAWYVSNTGYLVATDYSERGQETISLHRLILNVKRDQIIDHVDGDRLNNTRANLRIASRRLNRLNTTKAKGVRVTTSGKFEVRVGQQSFGSYATEEEALKVRRDIVNRLITWVKLIYL